MTDLDTCIGVAESKLIEMGFMFMVAELRREGTRQPCLLLIFFSLLKIECLCFWLTRLSWELGSENGMESFKGGFGGPEMFHVERYRPR